MRQVEETKEHLLAESNSLEAVNAVAVAHEAIEKARASQIEDSVKRNLPDNFLQAIQDQIEYTIKKTVNGKIDKIDKKIDEHNFKHEADMQDLKPIIEAYKYSERRVADAKSSGRFIIWVAGGVTAVGGAVLVIKDLFK